MTRTSNRLLLTAFLPASTEQTLQQQNYQTYIGTNCEFGKAAWCSSITRSPESPALGAQIMRAYQLAPAARETERCVCSCSCCTFHNPECAGCEATVSHGAPAHSTFCLATALRRSVSVPHSSLFALQHLRHIRSACQETCQPWMPVMGFSSRRCWPTV